jgi:hypothetical protein
MKNLSLACIIAAVCTSACTNTLVPTLKFNEVMQRSSVALQQIRSADMQIDLQAAVNTGNATFEIQSSTKGAMELAGARLQLAGNANVNGLISGMPINIQLNGEVIKMEDAAVYLKIDDLTIEPDEMLSVFGLQNVSSAWQQLVPAASGSLVNQPSLPLMPIQLDVFTVVKEEFKNSTYHYDVLIDKEKLQIALEQSPELLSPDLLQFIASHVITGSIEIDSTSFYTKKIHWQIAPITKAGSQYTMDIIVSFSNVNGSLPIIPPEDVLLLETGSTL